MTFSRIRESVQFLVWLVGGTMFVTAGVVAWWLTTTGKWETTAHADIAAAEHKAKHEQQDSEVTKLRIDNAEIKAALREVLIDVRWLVHRGPKPARPAKDDSP